MKKILFVLAGGALALASCDEEIIPGPTPVLSIEAETPDILAPESGTATIRYEIINADANAAVTAVCEAEWVYDLDDSVPGEVTFSVSENTERESRSTSVTLAYSDAEPVEIEVVQAGAEEVVPAEPFEISVTGITSFSARVTVTPADDEMTYLVLTGTKSDIDSYASDEELIAYNMALFSAVADTYGVSLEYILENSLLRTGKSQQLMDTFQPETEYYIYVYGVDKFANVLTDVYKVPFSTPAVTRYDETIVIDPYDIRTRAIYAEFRPETNAFRYVLGNLTKSEFDSIGEETFVSTMLQELQYVISLNTSLGNPMTWDNVTYNGTQKIMAPNLYSSTDYLLYAFGVDHGYQNTGFFSEAVTTESVEVTDDCTFEVSLASSGPYDAVVNIVPSSSSTRYFATVFESSQIAGLSEAVIADACINGANESGIDWSSASLFTGERAIPFSELAPLTSYTFVAFGASTAGERTTEVSLFTFSTQEVPMSDMTFDVTVTETSYSNVKVKVVPSAKDEEYVLGIMTDEQYAALGYDAEALGEKICRDNASLTLYQNVGDVEQYISWDYEFNFIKPGQKYHIFVMGCSHWYQTTPVTVVECETPERTESNVSVDINVTVYDGNDLIEAAPDTYPESTFRDKAAVYVEFVPDKNAASWYAWVEERSKEYMEGLNYDVLLSAIKANGTYFTSQKPVSTLLAMPWNYQNACALALAFDSSGVNGTPVMASLCADRSQIVELDFGNTVIDRYIPKRYLLSESALAAAIAGASSPSPEVRTLDEIIEANLRPAVENAGGVYRHSSEDPLWNFFRITGNSRRSICD